jgi:hypothetical protein
MSRYINENEIYALFNQRGQASLHVGDIDVLPRADVEPVIRAHWIFKPLEADGDLWLYHCSACANLSARPRAYCAECGAKMEVKVEYYDD